MKNEICTWCHGDGYFGDFGPGLYPLPCPHCAGTGIENVVSNEILAQIMDIRDELYERIKARTERLSVASKSFEMGVRIGLSKTLNEAMEYEIKRRYYLQKLGTFPLDYFEVEKDCLKEGWEMAIKLVEDKYKHLVEKHSRKVVGKSYKDNAIMEFNNFKHPFLKKIKKIEN